MCTVLLPPGDNPIAVNKCIISYHIKITFTCIPLHRDNVKVKHALAKSMYHVAEHTHLQSCYRHGISNVFIHIENLKHCCHSQNRIITRNIFSN